MPLCLLFCFIGLGLLWWTKRQKLGKTLVTLGLLLLTVLSYGSVADLLLRPLESSFPPYQATTNNTAGPVKYVVVLGGGHEFDPGLPVSSQIGDVTLKRLIEGIRIYHENPGSKLILSGGGWLSDSTDARAMADVAKILAVKEDDVILESASRDTADEARLLKPMLGTNTFILVTSATHMTRSMALFQRADLHPQAATAEHRVIQHHWGPGSFFPHGDALARTERAFYEYLGLAWVTGIGDRLEKRSALPPDPATVQRSGSPTAL
jgi:uncharacterized SAM-binding protein YcdF (DUF218 family)